MAEKLRLGVIGMSEGNGHPYSWSAIFNGYDPEIMQDCPFSGIPEYLGKRNFPEDSLEDIGKVSHVWTQSKEMSEHIAAAAKINTVVDDMRDMIGEVDAVLLARDDAENHADIAKPFIEAGIPIFIDKPLALTLQEFEKIMSWRKYESQVFTCSAMRYAKELMLSMKDREELGRILYVEAAVMKAWKTYGIHLLEPFVFQLENRGDLLKVKSIKNKEIQQTLVQWENVSAYLKVTGDIVEPYSIKFFGEKGNIEKKFFDPFSCFKNALSEFVQQIQTGKNMISENETMELIKILEWGRV
jgi:predicted dehydrogenase